MGEIIQGEFDIIGTTEPIGPDVKLAKPIVVSQVRRMNAEARANLNYAITQLLNGKMEKVAKWLDDVGERSPIEAVRLVMELTEFVQPRLKAANVNANLNADVAPGNRRLSDMSLEELDGLLGNTNGS